MNLLPAVTEHLSSRKKVIFSGTDPGTVVTSVTVPRTFESIFASINHFQVLADSFDDGAPYAFDVNSLPKPYKITVGLVNNITFLKKHQRKQQERQKCSVNKKVWRKKLAKEKREREI